MSHMQGAKEMLERVPQNTKEESLEDMLKSFSFLKRVLNNHVFVKIDNFQYKGSIIIPENAKRQPTKGIVVGVSADIIDIVVGDRVLYSQFAGYLLKFGETPLCRCLGYTEILGILESDAPILTVEGA